MMMMVGDPLALRFLVVVLVAVDEGDEIGVLLDLAAGGTVYGGNACHLACANPCQTTRARHGGRERWLPTVVGLVGKEFSQP